MKTILTCTLLALTAPIAAFAQNNPGSHFIENWDLNADGSVSTDEIAERRGDVFTTFDSDENGQIDATEYVLFDEARAADMAENAQGGGQGERRMQEGMTLAFNDVDGDGMVSKAEFIDRSKDWLALIDRNADGVITTDDFGPRSN